MDNYTKMASELRELQESYPIGSTGHIFYHENGEKYWLPLLEDLIGMLEERKRKGENKPWTINYISNIAYRKIADKGYRAWDYLDKPYYYGKTPQEAMLKLVAWELWGKTWNEDKEVWEEG